MLFIFTLLVYLPWSHIFVAQTQISKSRSNVHDVLFFNLLLLLPVVLILSLFKFFLTTLCFFSLFELQILSNGRSLTPLNMVWCGLQLLVGNFQRVKSLDFWVFNFLHRQFSPVIFRSEQDIAEFGSFPDKTFIDIIFLHTNVTILINHTFVTLVFVLFYKIYLLDLFVF